MSENRFIPCGASANGCGKGGDTRTVCVETNRILDSCRDRDCFENVRVFLTDLGREIIDRTTQVRVKDACIAWTYIGIDPVQFNRGFYTVHIRFYVKLIFEACVCMGGCGGHGGGTQATEFDGIAVLEKQVVLFGGDSSVSVFRSSSDGSAFCAEPEPCYKERSVPTAVVEVVEPIILGAKVLEPACREPVCCCCCACDVPHSIAGCLSGPLCGCDHGHEGHDGCHGGKDDDGRVLTVSLGIFSLVRLVRPAQYLISAADFVIPDKECVSGGPDNPCDLFRAMAFPVAEFSPAPMPLPVSDRNKCGCNG